MLCTSERGQITFFFVTLRKELAENANKSYHVYKVIVVLHIDNTSLGIRIAENHAIKNKSLVLRLFEEYIYTP